MNTYYYCFDYKIKVCTAHFMYWLPVIAEHNWKLQSAEYL